MADDVSNTPSLSAVEKMTVKLKKSKKGAIGNINVSDFDPELHEALTRKELEELEAKEKHAGKAAEDLEPEPKAKAHGGK